MGNCKEKIDLGHYWELKGKLIINNMGTNLRPTLSAGPLGVHLKERWL